MNYVWIALKVLAVLVVLVFGLGLMLHASRDRWSESEWLRQAADDLDTSAWK